jgi:hypothetical protein
MEPPPMVPGTLEHALMPSAYATVVTEGEPPYRIVHVSDEWCRQTGYR